MKNARLPHAPPARCFLPRPAAAKTLVFCSEGNPEALNPQLITTTTGMNAARPMFNNLVEFVPGTTEIAPALAESWEISDDGTRVHLPSAPGREVPVERHLHADAEMNADDVLFSLERQWKEDHPYHKVSGASFDYFKDIGMPDLLKSIDKLDDYTVRIRLTRPEAPFLADLAMPFNVILSAEYADAAPARRHAREARPAADRHRAVRVRRLPAGRRGPLPRLPGLLGRQAADRHAGLLDHAERRRSG